jgi:cbb3-type cytochrome oxidase maturation protein
MNSLLALIPVSLLLLGIAVTLFAWAVRSGQYEDIETPALDVLGDDSTPKPRDAD